MAYIWGWHHGISPITGDGAIKIRTALHLALGGGGIGGIPDADRSGPSLGDGVLVGCWMLSLAL